MRIAAKSKAAPTFSKAQLWCLRVTILSVLSHGFAQLPIEQADSRRGGIMLWINRVLNRPFKMANDLHIAFRGCSCTARLWDCLQPSGNGDYSFNGKRSQSDDSSNELNAGEKNCGWIGVLGWIKPEKKAMMTNIKRDVLDMAYHVSSNSFSFQQKLAGWSC